MCRQSFWEESANFATLDTKVMISAEGIKSANKAESMGIELSYHSTESRLENQTGSIYGNKKEKTSPFPTLAGKKTSYDAYIDHKLDCTHPTVEDKHCRTTCRMCLVSKRILPQLELIVSNKLVYDILAGNL